MVINPANLVRRVLPLADGNLADVAAIGVPVGRFSTVEPRAHEQNVLFARGRPEPDRTVAARQHDANRRYEVHFDVLRSELIAAMQLMEHR